MILRSQENFFFKVLLGSTSDWGHKSNYVHISQKNSEKKLQQMKFIENVIVLIGLKKRLFGNSYSLAFFSDKR